MLWGIYYGQYGSSQQTKLIWLNLNYKVHIAENSMVWKKNQTKHDS